jgi:hypothetical protein
VAGIACIIGGIVGYAISLTTWPALGAWFAVALIAYMLAFAGVIASGLIWMRSVAHETNEIASISFDLRQEFLRLDAAFTLAAAAYFLPLAAYVDTMRVLQLTSAGAVCGAAAILVRRLPIKHNAVDDSQSADRSTPLREAAEQPDAGADERRA